MTNVYTLDVLRDEMERRYAPVEIDLGNGQPVVLNNLMRLDSKKRKDVMDAMNVIQQEDDPEDPMDPDQVLTQILDIVALIADDPKRGKALTDAIGDDLALAMHILTLWTEATQPGEAQNSPV